MADYRGVEALLLEVPQVTSLEDPMFEAEQREAYRGPENERENMVWLTQSIPWFGKRNLRGLISGSEASEALAEYRMAILELRLSIHSAWWRLAYAQENAALLVEDHRLVDEARQATLALYQSGERDRSALLRLETEGAMITGLREENDGLGLAARHELERLLSASLSQATFVDQLGDIQALPELDLGKVLDLAFENRPELSAVAEAEKRSALQERLARADYYPDFTLGAGFRAMGEDSSSFYDSNSDGRTDSWQASVGLNIPIPNARRRAATDQARKRGEEARLRREFVAEQIMQEIGVSQAMIRSLRNQEHLYTSNIIPLAEEAAQSTSATYQSGRASYADLIDAQRTLIGARRERLRILMELAIATAELERAIGAPLTDTAIPEEANQ
jgi:outer membrane protein TolC